MNLSPTLPPIEPLIPPDDRGIVSALGVVGTMLGLAFILGMISVSAFWYHASRRTIATLLATALMLAGIGTSCLILNVVEEIR